VIESAEHVDTAFQEAQTSLDELFERTYGAIRAGREQGAAMAPQRAAPAASPTTDAAAAPA